MAADFSWTRSADVYMSMYHNLRPDIPLTQSETEAAPTEEVKPTKEAQPAEPEIAPIDEPAATPVKKPTARKTTARKTTAAKATAPKTATTKATTTAAKTATSAPAAAATPAAEPKPATPTTKVVPKATRRGKRK